MMRLIAITHPFFFEGESKAIRRLLDSGWWRVHIRKPEASADSVAALLDDIPPNYRGALSIHDHFGLASDYSLGGIHLNRRCTQVPAHWQGLVSRSCHSMAELDTCRQLDYLTLSPVYDSISKAGYSSRFDLMSLGSCDLHNVFALGGVTHARLTEISAAGFSGAAMLSEAWKTHNHMLQFITHTFDGVEDALKGGCRWVQLRMKEAGDSEFVDMAARIMPLCRKYGATLIFDDRVQLVSTMGADGVHLGKNDMPVAEARKILGPAKIIGATANTVADVMEAYHAGADYIGAGPFRFTTTKKNLAPILGLDGYRRIMSQCRSMGMNLPVVAIGGIRLDDLGELRTTGVSGIAVSGLILNSDDIKTTSEIIIHIWEN